MPLPDDVVQMTTALSHLLPTIPDAERKEYLIGVMNLVYEVGVVDGKMDMLNKSITEVLKGKEEDLDGPQGVG